MPSPETFSFITDVHGNLANIDAFLRASAQREVRHVIFGGDIAPKKVAVNFSDGKGFALTGAGQTDAASLPDFLQNPQETRDLYRRGYMLFESEWTSENVRRLASLLAKLNGEHLHSISFDLDEIAFLEERAGPVIQQILESSEQGVKLFSAYRKQYSAVYSDDDVYSAAEFVSRLVLLAKFRYAQNKRFARPEVISFLGLPESDPAAYFQAVNMVFNFSAVNSSPIFSFLAHQAGPWREWENIQNNILHHSEDRQRVFARDLFEMIRSFRQSFRRGLKVSVSAMLGNDDMPGLRSDFDEAEKEKLLLHATNAVVQLSDTTQLLGYSCVPPILDVEHDAWFASEEALAGDLALLARRLRPGKPFTVANIHCPPFDTNLDQARVPGLSQTHFGSSGVRRFLEKQTRRRITVALFGHIHDSHTVSGSIADRIGRMPLLNPGASEYTPRFLFGDLRKPANAGIYN